MAAGLVIYSVGGRWLPQHDVRAEAERRKTAQRGDRAQLSRRLWLLAGVAGAVRSEEHTSELQSLMRISYAVFCLKKQNQNTKPLLHCIHLVDYNHATTHLYH